MILVIRISGLVEVPNRIDETLFRMRLRRKYSAVLLQHTKENMKLLQTVRNFVAYGEISKETLKELIEKRGVSKDKKKIDADKIIQELDRNTLDKSNLKPFFRLHPPRKGIDSKLHYGVKKGVLGDNNSTINELLGRML